MYQDIEDPWYCKRESDSLHNRLFLEILFHDRKPYKSILDIGCGLGEFTNLTYKRNGDGEIAGWDTSKTAIKKATKAYPNICFSQRDILSDVFYEQRRFKLVLLSEVIWYLLNGIDAVFQRIDNMLESDGILGIKQYFPLDQKYGRDHIDGLRGFDNFIHRKTRFRFHTKVTSDIADGSVLMGILRK